MAKLALGRSRRENDLCFHERLFFVLSQHAESNRTTTSWKFMFDLLNPNRKKRLRELFGWINFESCTANCGKEQVVQDSLFHPQIGR